MKLTFPNRSPLKYALPFSESTTYLVSCSAAKELFHDEVDGPVDSAVVLLLTTVFLSLRVPLLVVVEPATPASLADDDTST